MDQAQMDEDREVLTQVTLTDDELRRFKLALSVGGFLLLSFMYLSTKQRIQIYQLLTFASETTQYLESKEIADAAFRSNILNYLIEKKGA